MAGLLLRRLGALILTLLVASVVIFGALYLAPGDPATLLVGNKATPAGLQHVRELYRLDDPVHVRYWHWLTGALRGDLGESFTYKQSVWSLIEGRIGTSVLLIGYASVLVLVLGIASGIAGGLHHRAGAAITVVTGVGLATPTYVAAIFLITAFAVELGWFPVFGDGAGLPDRLYHLTLPAAALALTSTAFVAQMTKAAVREEALREHVECARSRGLGEGVIVRRHVLRNALIPITTVAGLTVAGFVAGTVVVEQAFRLDGIGSLLVQATASRDFALVQGICLLLVVVFVVVNVGVDLVNAALDPRLQARRSA
ncbi:ABC transporter permease [Nonomuraea typhae]|uniref:ABC transporter permease n=1 Tax=Nonomuraea typhae TaxID=2603600 RepID=A0ABW7ZCG2_9ACTN